MRTGQYHVVGAVRDLEKMDVVAEIEDFDRSCFTAMEVELNSFASVRKFVKDLDAFRLNKPVDRLICNAGIYQPSRRPFAETGRSSADFRSVGELQSRAWNAS